MYEVKDNLYASKQVQVGTDANNSPIYVVFENSLAQVPDTYISQFQNNSEFTILSHTVSEVSTTI